MDRSSVYGVLYSQAGHRRTQGAAGDRPGCFPEILQRIMIASINKSTHVRQPVLICTPNTGHPVLGAILCDTVMSTRSYVLKCTDKENGQKRQ